MFATFIRRFKKKQNCYHILLCFCYHLDIYSYLNAVFLLGSLFHELYLYFSVYCGVKTETQGAISCLEDLYNCCTAASTLTGVVPTMWAVERYKLQRCFLKIWKVIGLRLQSTKKKWYFVFAIAMLYWHINESWGLKIKTKEMYWLCEQYLSKK